jgi:hypothetical protein
MPQEGRDTPTDPLGDEAYIANVADITDEALEHEDVQELLGSGLYTPETVARLAALIVAQEDGKLSEYAPKARQVSKQVIKLLGKEDEQA